MGVLLSIKPQYVDKIIDQTKKYEFRKKIFKKVHNDIYIYSTSPEKKIVGIMSISNIICDKPTRLWKLCRDYAGIDRDDFFEYFGNAQQGYALEITAVQKFRSPVDITKSKVKFTAPQSFCYFDRENLKALSNA